MAATWQGYVDQLIGSGHIARAAIITRANGTPVAASAGFALKDGEAAAILKLYADPSKVFSTGVTVGGTNYRGIKGVGRSIYGQTGGNGAVLVRTDQTILIGLYTQQQQPGNAANVVEKLADHLLSGGY
ncbi:profilin [Streptomyces sp. JNUCC 64]